MFFFSFSELLFFQSDKILKSEDVQIRDEFFLISYTLDPHPDVVLLRLTYASADSTTHSNSAPTLDSYHSFCDAISRRFDLIPFYLSS